ncbi:MAG: hypothetical protein IPJ74_26700 [Saprospiraceae bacterium]|nr:hypothetical protein [Saprospiraceae bacterium]
MPHLDSRSDLRVLINDMLGELNSSHLGFNSFGQEENIFYKTRTAETGIIFKEDAPYTVQYIVNTALPTKRQGYSRWRCTCKSELNARQSCDWTRICFTQPLG